MQCLVTLFPQNPLDIWDALLYHGLFISHSIIFEEVPHHFKQFTNQFQMMDSL